MNENTHDPADLKSTAHIRPFVDGQLLTTSVLNEMAEAMRHLDRRLTALERLAGIDVPPLAPPYDPNKNPLPFPGGDFESDPKA